jgi:polysaccharide export outer membrane protein
MMTLACVCLLSGCSLIPGMRADDLPETPEVTPLMNGMQVQLQPVTAELITTLSVPQSVVNPALAQLFQQQPVNSYRLQRGDVLSIYMWAYPELTPPLTTVNANNAEQLGFKVDQQGNLSFPLIGQIRAEGKTVTTLQNELNQRLKRYLKQPDAQIKVLQYKGRKFFVGGEVRVPGQYALNDEPLNLYGALSQAGGLLATGDLNAIVLNRQGTRYEFSILELQKQGLSPNQLLIQDSDDLYIISREGRKIYFLGEAGRPTPIILREQGMSLADVIGEGAGLNPLSANPAKVYVLRDQPEANLSTVYQLDLSSFTSLALAQRFAVQPRDIIYVDASGLARWSRVLNLLLPSASAIRTSQLISNGE